MNETKPSGARRVVRRLCKFILRTAAFGAVVFAAWTGYYWWQYDVSPVEAGEGVARDTALLAIRAYVAIHDPYTPKEARLGPDAELPAGYQRLEDYLAQRFDAPVAVVEIRNERIIHNRRRFGYQPYDEPRLHELRRRYKLDEVVAGAATELEKIVRLRSWCRSQFRRIDYQPDMENFDALTVLDRNLQNITNATFDEDEYYDPCHFFPIFFAQVATSMGYSSRVLCLNNPGNQHGIVDIWSNQHRKWIVMDAEFNHHFEKDGVPLGFLEILDESFAEGPTRVELVRGTQTSDPNTALVHLKLRKLETPKVLTWFKTNIDIVDLRNDWMTNHYFPGHPARSDANSLVYTDPRVTKPLHFNQRLRPRTTSKDDVSWTLNQAEIYARSLSCQGTLALGFKTVTPNFAHYEIVVNDGEKITTAEPRFDWALREGENRLSVRTVNQFGVPGIESTVKLVWHPEAG